MNKPGQTYNSKILLFGEYLLMKGSLALTAPFPEYSGKLAFSSYSDPKYFDSSKSLKLFCNYLSSQKDNLPAGLDFDFDKLQNDLEGGLYLDSDIPQGYGVGSSGVLVASVYQAYAVRTLLSPDPENLLVLKEYFSFMESYFHGKSSGLDPLSCYVARPLLVSSPEKIDIVEFPPKKDEQNLDIFLLDTGLTSKTEGLVRIFLEKSKNTQYKEELDKQMIPANDKCIEYALNGQTGNFLKQVSRLSALQLEHFEEMIPKPYRELWQNGIATGDYYLKLCGSGGGGFILGFSTDIKKAEEIAFVTGKKILPVFKSR